MLKPKKLALELPLASHNATTNIIHSAIGDQNTSRVQAHATTLAFYPEPGHGKGPLPLSEDAIVRDQVASLLPDPVSVEGLAAGLCAFLSVYKFQGFLLVVHVGPGTWRIIVLLQGMR